MIIWQLFLAFFIPAIIGYGGGPASIPLVQHEVVQNYGWLTNDQFAEMLAVSNALPGPIATKMAGYVGFSVAGWVGALVTLLATILPSLFLMLLFMGVLMKFKDAPQVQRLTSYVRPVICLLLVVMTYQFISEGVTDTGWVHTVVLIAGSYILLEKVKLHPAYVILVAMVYGGFLLS
ncbi:chromate transporter [Aureibacillus halotolerans]|uniref:Chromate transporter n=1 Tax=Aureibacillus halotolerans TaxID=1508390 RepID=A0A4R6UA62_9BACI|nr:chromate transporter [Aureibacillus halotolerans]TDQ42732.1 chromate transporter [Aureibacillus halotolerans]